MASERLKRIWEETKANHALLRSCTGHRFAVPEVTEPLLGRLKVTCQDCGGTMDVLTARQYLDGVLDTERKADLVEAARTFNEQLTAALRRLKEQGDER